MKFLCVACDEAMKLVRTLGPDQGSLSAVFACPKCGRETAMLTNSMETQMVRSLGVKIGGRTAPPEPMEMVRSSLAEAVPLGEAPRTGSPAAGSTAGALSPANSTGAETTGSKCPFAGVVAEAMSEPHPAIAWTPEAQERIDRIPDFARPMVKLGVEMHAREHGLTTVDESVIDQVKSRYGM